jgi:solute carrier family 25 protein 38
VAFFEGGGFGYCVATRGLGRDADADEAARIVRMATSVVARETARIAPYGRKIGASDACAREESAAWSRRASRKRGAGLPRKRFFESSEEPPAKLTAGARGQAPDVQVVLRVPARVVTHSSTPSSFAMDAADVASDSESYDDASASGASRGDAGSDVSSVPPSSPRTGLGRALRAGEHARAKIEALANDIHDAYSFDLNPEYRLKVVKKFDGVSLGAKFDFRSGQCVIKAKRAPSDSGRGWRIWRWFKKLQVQPEDGDVEVFTEPISWGLLNLQGIGGYKHSSGKFSFRYKVTSTIWEVNPSLLAPRKAEFGGERVGGCVRWDVDIKPPQAEGGFGDGMTAADLYGLDVGSYHVALPRLEMKIDLSNLEAARERAEREAAETTY